MYICSGVIPKICHVFFSLYFSSALITVRRLKLNYSNSKAIPKIQFLKLELSKVTQIVLLGNSKHESKD